MQAYEVLVNSNYITGDVGQVGPFVQKQLKALAGTPGSTLLQTDTIVPYDIAIYEKLNKKTIDYCSALFVHGASVFGRVLGRRATHVIPPAAR